MIELIQTAERSNIKNPIAYIAKESEIDRKILAKWIKEKNTLNNLELVGSARKIHQGPPLKYELQEKEVLDRVKHGFLYYEKSSWCFFKVFRLSKLIL